MTGGAGYVGSHTLHHLIRNGYSPESIIVVDNLCRGSRDAVPHGVHFAEVDLLDTEVLVELFRRHDVSAVIHFAGFAYVDESMADPTAYYRTNVVAGLSLLEAMVRVGCRAIVFSSTCATYGTPSSVPIAESEPQIPINPYGETKLVFERALEWYERCHGIRHVILRYFNAAGAAYGVGSYGNHDVRMIPAAVLAAMGRRPPVKIFGTDYETSDGTCVRDYVHVADLAEGHCLALEHLREDGASTALNLGSGRGSSVLNILEAVHRIGGRPVPNEKSPRRLCDPPTLIADTRLAQRILGWHPAYTLDDIISSVWHWHQSMVMAR
ncbi:UDP-glucose 4-epimerase [Paramagnetospirillum magnetotacticum MS-1]|uniref:UDP-glucose 4-epimerase n=1 Tax=Paramagnetospirillum magnetotacticum MS-1 TaxID=272627 RepID=A0A0C2YIM2_PARME|nr:UDP-glucose 4-epimerase [Paramagnetospirillum magnetotacticum MS-1]